MKKTMNIRKLPILKGYMERKAREKEKERKEHKLYATRGRKMIQDAHVRAERSGKDDAQLGISPHPESIEDYARSSYWEGYRTELKRLSQHKRRTQKKRIKLQ